MIEDEDLYLDHRFSFHRVHELLSLILIPRKIHRTNCSKWKKLIDELSNVNHVEDWRLGLMRLVCLA